jgi:hypothetical protein
MYDASAPAPLVAATPLLPALPYSTPVPFSVRAWWNHGPLFSPSVRLPAAS